MFAKKFLKIAIFRTIIYMIFLFRIAKMDHTLQSVENHFLLKSNSQVNEEELYLEMCSNDFEVDIKDLDGYQVKLIDLSVIIL